MAGLCATSDPIVGNNLDERGFNRVKERSSQGASWVSDQHHRTSFWTPGPNKILVFNEHCSSENSRDIA